MDKKKVGIIVAILVAIIIAIILFFALKPAKEEVLYEVTFKDYETSDVIKVEENGTITKPTDPKKEGYTFEGWYYNEMKFDFTTKITEDITLEARWTKNDVKKWAVTFDTDGANSIDALNVEDGKTPNNNELFYASHESKITINGGKFIGNTENSTYGTRFTLNKLDNDKSTIIVTGGTFVKYNPAASLSENPQANFVAEGYKVVNNGDEYTVVAE